MQRLIKTTCAIAAEDLGKEKAERIAKAAQRRYEELLVENACDSKALRKHTYQRIYPAIAVYETFKAGGTEPEKAVWYIREYFQRFAASFVPHLKRVIRWFGLAKKVPKLFMSFSLKGFGPEAGFEYEFPETSGNEARFNIVRCPYWETCRRYGARKSRGLSATAMTQDMETCTRNCSGAGRKQSDGAGIAATSCCSTGSRSGAKNDTRNVMSRRWRDI